MLVGFYGISETVLGAVAVSSGNTVPVDPLDPPVDPPPGGSSDNTIVYKLITVEGYPVVNLAGLDWSLFTGLRASQFGAPVAQGTLASTNNLAVLSIQVPKETVPVGQYFLVLTDAAGDVTLACKVSVV